MEFKAVQQAFMDYIKDPSRPLPDGIERRRMAIYRELFFNNIDGFVSNAFPVLKSLYKEADWQALVQSYFVSHDNHTPIFLEIAQEFLIFLQTEYQPKDIDPPFMLELAHYEWLELVVAIAQEDVNQRPITSIDEIKTQPICLVSTARVAQYAFDVQHISVDHRPEEPASEPQFFCIYRDADDEVCFLQLNPLTAQLLAHLSQFDGLDFDALSTWLTATFTDIEADALINGCASLLLDLSQKGIICRYAQ